MPAVLDLDPVLRSAGAIGPVAALGHDPLEPELAGLAEEVASDLAAFEVRGENAIRPMFQKPGQICLAHRERQLAQVAAVERQAIGRADAAARPFGAVWLAVTVPEEP